MLILFDLQDNLAKMKSGASLVCGFLLPGGEAMPQLDIAEIDNVKFVNVTNRTKISDGAVLMLDSLEDAVLPGDRVVITGRLARNVPNEGWGISLFSVEERGGGESPKEGAQLTQQIAPKGMYTLSYQIGAGESLYALHIQTTQWRSYVPIMDFTIDSILVTRITDCTEAIKDRRGLVYSLNRDTILQSAPDKEPLDEGTIYLRRSGTPVISAVKNDKRNILRLDNRTKDYDGLDLRLEELELIRGNEYKVTVTGYADGETGEDAQITFQGLPGFTWRGTQPLVSNAPFKLEYILGKSTVGKWTDLRITTNMAGAACPLVIQSIDIVRIAGLDEGDKDERGVVYSLDDDALLQRVTGNFDFSDVSRNLRRSGTPDVSILRSNDKNIIRLTKRNKDWDGLDIILGNFGLLDDSMYHVKVMGYVEGEAEDGARVVLQSIPGYGWRSTEGLASNEPFTISHSFGGSAINEWSALRIATNSLGASCSIVISSIEITSGGGK